MKAVILAGGWGSRLAEETSVRPKPMVEIGGAPIIWHIISIYSAHGISEFIVCLGYMGYVIKEYFANYALHASDVTVDMRKRSVEFHSNKAEPWRVTLVDTGLETLTGGRLKRVAEHIGDETFCMTYGDGVADVDITKLIRFHEASGKLATLTATRPPGRFGIIDVDGANVRSFQEKPDGEGWVNGGFFVLSPKVMDYIEGDQIMWERQPLERLARDGQLAAYRHHGFWAPMDTLRDKRHLEELWNSGRAPWKVW